MWQIKILSQLHLEGKEDLSSFSFYFSLTGLYFFQALLGEIASKDQDVQKVAAEAQQYQQAVKVWTVGWGGGERKWYQNSLQPPTVCYRTKKHAIAKFAIKASLCKIALLPSSPFQNEGVGLQIVFHPLYLRARTTTIQWLILVPKGENSLNGEYIMTLQMSL